MRQTNTQRNTEKHKQTYIEEKRQSYAEIGRDTEPDTETVTDNLRWFQDAAKKNIRQTRENHRPNLGVSGSCLSDYRFSKECAV